jgi:hypothetical protein
MSSLLADSSPSFSEAGPPVRVRVTIEGMVTCSRGLRLTRKLVNVVDVLQGRVRTIKGPVLILLRGRAYVSGQSSVTLAEEGERVGHDHIYLT